MLEKEILLKLEGIEGFPKIYDESLIEDKPMLIMNELGHNLRFLKDKYNNRLSAHSCLQIFHQIVLPPLITIIYIFIYRSLD